MKRTFMKVLPFAAALLLATSCSKDDSNSVDEIVNGGEQIETVVKTFKTLTVKGKVNKSISKVTTNDAGTALAFEGNEVFAFGNESDDVYGTIDFTNADGSYTATINYTDETVLSGNFTATLGTNPATISAAYDDLAAAVKNAYYTIDFTITQNEGEYKLKSDNSSDIVVNLQSAFIKSLAGNTEKLGGISITVEAGKYYVVPVGKVMGETQNTTVAGKIYTIKAPVQSVTINTNGVTSKVWGNAAFDVTVSISPSDATNQTVDWSKSTNVKVTDKGNGTYSVLITGNTGGKATLIATVDGVSSTAAEITVDPDYVDLGTGYVYWKTSDDDPMSGYWAVQKNAPPDYYFNLLWNANLVERSGTKFTNKNGSGASITLQSAHYWTSMVNSSTNAGVYFIVTSDGYTSQQGSRDDVKNVRAVRSQQ